MDEELHLPWDRLALEELLIKVVSTGETTKVDLKRIFDLAGVQQQGEFLKDISAIANTYNHNYRNHGFIIFGAESNKITYTSFSDSVDHLQANIDDLIKKYLGPFITTHLYIFGENESQWGALVIPPTRNAPHIFINDIHKRYRGDVYVRSGTITEKAQPGDFSRFFSQHLEEHIYKFQQEIVDLRQQISNLASQLLEVKNLPRLQNKKINAKESNPVVIEFPKKEQSIVDTIDNFFAKEEDIIEKGLFEEVRKINDFLDSETIPWALSKTDKKQSEEIFSKIESNSNKFWSAIISLVSKDEKGAYDEAIIRSLTYLARQNEAPNGIAHSELGKNIRYFPLFIALYLISIIGVAKKRNKLLNKIFKIKIQGRSHYDEPLPITYILFFIRRANEVFHPMYHGYPDQKWCDPVASYTKLLIDKILLFPDPLWDKEREFYNGEFILCLSPMDVIEKDTNKPLTSYPSAGLYLVISSAVPIITRFLKQEKDWIIKIFERPLETLLSEFDDNVSKLNVSSGCWNDGFQGGALEAAFPNKIKKE